MKWGWVNAPKAYRARLSGFRMISLAKPRVLTLGEQNGKKSILQQPFAFKTK
jgi:hypothetical protein